MTGERDYRVYVEKFERGWVTVSAPNEHIARDRAQDVVGRDWWYPEQSHVQALRVEVIPPPLSADQEPV